MTCWRYIAAWTPQMLARHFCVRTSKAHFRFPAATIRFEVASPLLMSVRGPCPHTWYTCVHSALDPMCFKELLLAMASRYLSFGADDPPNGVSHGAACLFFPTFDVSPKCFAWSVSLLHLLGSLRLRQKDKYASCPICEGSCCQVGTSRCCDNGQY
jgi:hypothetical protein